MSRPLRVAMLLDRAFPPDPRVANEARSLAGAGHDVHLFCLRFGGRDPEKETWAGVKLHRLLIPRWFARKASAVSLEVPAYRWYLRRGWTPALARLVPDVVHAHDLPLADEGARAARSLGASFVVDLHESWPAALATYGYARRFPGRFLISPARWARHERKVLGLPQRILVVVEEARERLLRMGFEAERIAVVRNTVSVDEFEGFGIEGEVLDRFRGRFVLSYLGGFERHRGLETVVDAMPEIVRRVPSARLLLVGSGSTEAGLKRRVDALGLGDRVDFEGWQPFRRFPTYIEASSVCLIPHVKSAHTDTTIPHKLFHTMLLARPVLATDCDPLRRILEETGAGIVVRSGDAAELADAAARLANPDLRQRLGEAGRAAVLDRYNWERDAAGLLRVYEELGEERARSSS